MKTGTGVHVLFVDDDESTRSGLQNLLELDGYEVDLAEDGVAALARVTQRIPDVVITDLEMPRLHGMRLLERLKAERPRIPVIVVTDRGDTAAAVAAMRAGAEHYLVKPLDPGELGVALERALGRRDLRTEAEILRRQTTEGDTIGLERLLGSSPAMQEIRKTAVQIGPAKATVLITGESGTGKGELARAIHARSPRADGPFVSLHCSALAETLLESELFGHEKGAFTGADRRRIGRFELADGGTLFLDEIGEMPPSLQIKLLRVLQERVFERVGGNETIAVDVRLVAATNRDLAAEAEAGRFRQDLYYRLNVVHIEMPPLRARGDDVLLLADHFLARFAKENHKRLVGFADEARARILAHHWPGNVRELENAVESAVVLATRSRVEAKDLPPSVSPMTRNGAVPIPGATMAEIERYAIEATLEAVGGSTSRAAEMLEISPRTIQYRLHEYGLAKRRP